MKVILDVKPEELDQALSVAKTHLTRASDQMLHGVSFYLAGGKVVHYHSRLVPGAITVWRSEELEHKRVD